METKHTPGPWKWDSDPCNSDADYRDNNAPWLIAANHEIVLGGDIFAGKPSDAALIASAPTLLEALKAFVDTATAFEADCDVAPDYLTQARAAIAQAEGE